MASRRKKGVDEINAGSMADIAFLLLIFFLVTTTMDQEYGIQRKLPEKVEVPPESIVKKRNVFQVLVNQNDELLVNNEPGDIKLLKDRVKEFILNVNDDGNMSEKNFKDIELLGNFGVSKGVISLQNDRLTSYEKYIEVQNVLARAFNEMRNDLAMNKFGKTYDQLASLVDDETAQKQAEAISDAIPLNISEAEPNNSKR